MSRLDQTAALRILKANSVVTTGITPNVRVTSVTSTNGKTGQPFVWEDSKEPYAIVNFQAMNTYGAKKALAEFKAEQYDECVNNNLSARVSLEVADKLRKSLYATIEVAPATLKDGSTAELVRKVIPNEPNVATKVADMFAKELPETTPANADGKF